MAILHRFGDIATYCAHDPPLFHPNFWSVPVADVGVSLSMNLKLLGREIIFEVFQNVITVGYLNFLNITDRQTDRLTDGRTDGRHRPTVA